nr:MATE family efflux transporter [Chitinophaga flava]
MSVGISLLLVPLLIGRLGTEQYGVWATLLSTAQWITLMDIGIGSGLRNKLTEALAKGDLTEANEYVSTAYITLLLIGAVLAALFVPFFFLVNWNSVFNTHSISSLDLSGCVFVFFYGILSYLILAIINQIINAVQRNSLTTMIPIIINVLFITSVYIYSLFHPLNLLFVTCAYTASQLIAIAIVSSLFFREYDYLKPLRKNFKKDKIRSIMGLGLKFFIIQITVVIIFSTDNFVITQLLGPSHVTTYGVVLLVFNNMAVFVNMLMAPLWSSYTEAYAKGDLGWIKGKIVFLNKLMIPYIIGVGVVVLLFNTIVNVWLGKAVVIPDYLPALMGVYAVISVWNNIYGFMLGGISKVRLGMITTVFIGCVNIPLSIFFARNLNLGLNGIILSNILCLSLSSVISPIQAYYFIFSTRKSDRWERILS